MDHKSLEYFIKAQKLNRRQVYWIFYLSRFNFTFKYMSDTKMKKAGRLSQKLDWKVGIENDNSDQILIKKQQICNLGKTVIEGSKVEIVEKI